MKIFSLNRNTENSVVVTAQLLRLLNVNVTQESLQNSLTAHPDYPSIISITDVLYKYKIDSSIIKVAWDDIDKLETPFITRLKFNDGAFVVITKVSKEHIEYLKPHYKITPARISKGNFLNYGPASHYLQNPMITLVNLSIVRTERQNCVITSELQ